MLVDEFSHPLSQRQTLSGCRPAQKSLYGICQNLYFLTDFYATAHPLHEVVVKTFKPLLSK